jgi:hypothetical protein
MTSSPRPDPDTLHAFTLDEVRAMMGNVPRSTARHRLAKAGVAELFGRHPTSRRVAVLYPREDVERMLREGFKPPGRPSTKDAKR